MSYSRFVLVITGLTLLLMMVFGEYVFRWGIVVLFAVLLTLILFGWELEIPSPKLKGDTSTIRERREVKALSKLIQKAEKGKTARSLIEERIIEIYSEASEDYRETYSKLRSHPNEAIKTLRREGDFIKNLEEALKIVEADLNED